MPSKTIFVDEVPKIAFDKGLFRVSFSTGNDLVFRPHDFMVGVRAAQTAIEKWFAEGQQEPADFRKRAEH